MAKTMSSSRCSSFCAIAFDEEVVIEMRICR